MTAPRVALALLDAFCRDEALGGDILEEFEHRQSRAWLWSQVATVVLLGLSYRRARARRSGRMPMPIGEIGLLTMVMLVTMVAPGAWWLIGIGIAGGGVIGTLLVVAGRRHAVNRGRRNILLPLILLGVSLPFPTQAQPRPAVRIGPVNGTVEASATHRVVILPGRHGSSCSQSADDRPDPAQMRRKACSAGRPPTALHAARTS